MDNIGFFELILVGVVALLVLGPEKLPGAIRTASLWIGRLKRSFNTIKTDIEKEIGADEIRRQLRNEAIMDKFKQTKAQVNDAVNTVKKQTDEFRKSVELEAQAANPMASGSIPSQTEKSTTAGAEPATVVSPDSVTATAATPESAPANTQTVLFPDADKTP